MDPVSTLVPLAWDGPVGGTVFPLNHVRDSTLAHLKITPGSSTYGIGIDLDQIGPGTTTTRDNFEDLWIEAATIAAIRVGHSRQGNADLCTWTRVVAGGSYTAVTPDGFLMEYSNAKLHRLYDCSLVQCQRGFHSSRDGGGTGGNVQARGTNFERNDIDIQVDYPSDVITFDGFYSENSGRLLWSGSSAGNAFPIKLSNGTWNSIRLNADGIAIRYCFRGPLVLDTVLFSYGPPQPAFKILLDNTGGLGATINVKGCHFPTPNPFLGKIAPGSVLESCTYTDADGHTQPMTNRSW